MYAIFRASIRIIDKAKRATLSRLLLNSVMTTAPGEKLDDKLALLSLPPEYCEREPMSDPSEVYSYLTASLVPPPSTDDIAWWDSQSTYALLSLQTPV